MLGITTVGTAWCGYEASQWNGQQSDLARQSSDERVEAGRLFGLATQKVAYDSSIIAQYAVAAQAGNTALTDFYRKTLVRSDFLPVLDKWIAEVKAGGTPTNLTEDQDYLNAQFADYKAATAKAEALSAESQAGRQYRRPIRGDHHPARGGPVLRGRDVVIPVPTGAGVPAHPRGGDGRGGRVTAGGPARPLVAGRGWPPGIAARAAARRPSGRRAPPRPGRSRPSGTAASPRGTTARRAGTARPASGTAAARGRTAAAPVAATAKASSGTQVTTPELASSNDVPGTVAGRRSTVPVAVRTPGSASAGSNWTSPRGQRRRRRQRDDLLHQAVAGEAGGQAQRDPGKTPPATASTATARRAEPDRDPLARSAAVRGSISTPNSTVTSGLMK